MSVHVAASSRSTSQNLRFASGLRQYDQKNLLGSVNVPPSPQVTPRVTLSNRDNQAVRPGSPVPSPRNIQHRPTLGSGLAFTCQAVRQQSLPVQQVQPVQLVTRLASQQPFSIAMTTPDSNFQEVVAGQLLHEVVAGQYVHDSEQQGLQINSPRLCEGRGLMEPMLHDTERGSPADTFNSEMELTAPSQAWAPVSLQELNVAIRRVMHTIEEERAVRANETADLRREVYQSIHQERDTPSREFKELKAEVSMQHEMFMKEICSRSVYEARLQNEVDQMSKDPQELRDKLDSVERQMENFQVSIETLLAATQQAGAPPTLGPEVLKDPMLVELLVASAHSSLETIHLQLHELVGQKIEEHLGRIDDSNSLFGMVREALSSSRYLKDEMSQVKAVMGPTPSSPLLEQAATPRRDQGQGGKVHLHKTEQHAEQRAGHGLNVRRYERRREGARV